ncbi:MAG: sulfatase [Planctomycetota bacterium]
MRRSYATTTIAAAVMCLGLTAGQVVGQKPNIVFIFADDLGWSDTSNAITNQGNPSDFYETPTVERLAAEGMAFTNAYTNGANCAPTRAALLTGQYAARPTNNVFAVDNLNRGGDGTLLVGPDQGLPSGVDGIPNDSFTYAEMLQQASYRTGHFGKFHVVDAGTAASDVVNFHGFHENYGGNTRGTPGNYFASSGAFGSSISPSLDAYAADYTQAYVDENIKPFATPDTSQAAIDALVGTRKHVSDAMADAAIDFMNREKETSDPFLVQFNAYAVHTPIGNSQARGDLLAKYQAKLAGNPGVQDDNAAFGAILEGLDQNIARLMDYLETTPDPNNAGQVLAENTLVLFYSDNGGQLSQSNNGPLRGEKGELQEGGIRVPLIAWSGDGGLVDGGTVNHTPVAGFDFYKTFATLSQAGEPAGVTLDGEDLTPILADSTADLGRDALYWHFPGYLTGSGRNQRPQTVVRSGDWKAVYNYEDQSYELYNLATDIGETTNVAGEPANGDVLADLALRMMLWLRSTDAPLATLRSGTMSVTVDGGFYADNQVQTEGGTLSIGAGQEVPFVLGDLTSLADLDRDGAVDAADWQAFRAGQGGDFDGLDLLEGFARGDLDGDQDNDVLDFILFKESFELANGAGSFSSLLGVPEPSTATAVGAAAAVLLSTRARRSPSAGQ